MEFKYVNRVRLALENERNITLKRYNIEKTLVGLNASFDFTYKDGPLYLEAKDNAWQLTSDCCSTCPIYKEVKAILEKVDGVVVTNPKDSKEREVGLMQAKPERIEKLEEIDSLLCESAKPENRKKRLNLFDCTSPLAQFINAEIELEGLEKTERCNQNTEAREELQKEMDKIEQLINSDEGVEVQQGSSIIEHATEETMEKIGINYPANDDEYDKSNAKEKGLKLISLELEGKISDFTIFRSANCTNYGFIIDGVYVEMELVEDEINVTVYEDDAIKRAWINESLFYHLGIREEFIDHTISAYKMEKTFKLLELEREGKISKFTVVQSNDKTNCSFMVGNILVEMEVLEDGFIPVINTSNRTAYQRINQFLFDELGLYSKRMF